MYLKNVVPNWFIWENTIHKIDIDKYTYYMYYKEI